jgi:Lon protease-like protein
MSIEIPLFPFSYVLFPGMQLPLHIFEPRYRLMIAECHEQEKPFGVVLARPESTPLQEEPYPVGTMAEIEALDRLKDGRMNIITRGTQRFRILSQHRERPYLSGVVEVVQDSDEAKEVLALYAGQARKLFSAYLEIVLAVVGKKDARLALPTQPEELSHFIAYFLDVQEEQKQYLLELISTQQRLREEIATLRKEVPFMRQVLAMSNRANTDKPDRSMLN